MINVLVVGLGCPKNTVDTEIMIDKLRPPSFALTYEEELADVVLINTCGFIESARVEAIENILYYLELKKTTSIKAVVVTGCVAQRYKEELLIDIPEITAIVGLTHQGEIADIIEDAYYGISRVEVSDFDRNVNRGDRVLTTLPHVAYLKIADGCDNRCSYCAIPLIRGGFISRDIDDLVMEAKKLVAEGVRELVLISQDSTRFGEDTTGKPLLPELMERLSKIEDLAWIRVMYLYPERISDDIIRAMKETPKVLPYFEMPIQHGSKKVLNAMNRKLGGEELLQIIEKIKSEIPNAELRSTIMVGFPGETDEDFEYLLDFLNKAKFSKVGCFAFSPEEDTKAALMDNQLPQDVKDIRYNKVMETQSQITKSERLKRIGSVCTAVVEYQTDDSYILRPDFEAPEIDYDLYLKTDKALYEGEFVKVRIKELLDTMDFIGELCEV